MPPNYTLVMPEIVFASNYPSLMSEQPREQTISACSLLVCAVSDHRELGSLPNHLERRLKTTDRLPDAQRRKALTQPLTRQWATTAPGTPRERYGNFIAKFSQSSS